MLGLSSSTTEEVIMLQTKEHIEAEKLKIQKINNLRWRSRFNKVLK